MTIFEFAIWFCKCYVTFGIVYGAFLWMICKDERIKEECTGLISFLTWEGWHAFLWLPWELMTILGGDGNGKKTN